MNWKIAAIVALCIAPAAWSAPTTRPAGSPRLRPGERLERWMEAHGQEWSDAFQFFEQYSPRRAAAFKEMTDKQKEKFRPLILERYAAMKLMGRNDPQIQKLQEQEYQIEDAIFGIKQELMKDPPPDTSLALKQELKAKIRNLTETRMSERELRLTRLENLLTRERQQLESDRKQKDQVIERRYEEVLNAKDPDAAADRPRPRRPDGDRPNKGPARK